MKKQTALFLLSGTARSDSNIRYLSGFCAPDPFLLAKMPSGLHLVVSPMEKGRAEKQSRPGTRVHTPADLGLKGKGAGRFGEQVLALAERERVRRIEVASDFPAGVFQALERRGLKVSVKKGAVCPERGTKTRREIALLRASQRAAVAAMDAAVGLIASSQIGPDGALEAGGEPLTSESVRRLIHKTLIDCDCVGVETIVAGGEQATDPHERGHGPLRAGEAIIIDIFPRSETSGYWGDLTRTVCRGPAGSALKRLYRAVAAAQRAALGVLAPGVRACDVHAAAKALFEERGYHTEVVDGRHVGFIHGTGHGVGLDIHEFPRIGTNRDILEPGNVVTVEPGLYYPGLGGVRIEDTVVLTEKGWRHLARCARKFELL